MDRQEWSLQDAKNSFSAVVRRPAKGRRKPVTKRGKPAVVVLSVTDYEKLARKAAGQRPSFVEHLLAMPKDDGVFERTKIKLRNVRF